MASFESHDCELQDGNLEFQFLLSPLFHPDGDDGVSY